MPFINVGELSLSYTEVGTGEPLLFIPGLVGVHKSWEGQIAHFSKKYRCISFDHRGAGDSDKPSDLSGYTTEKIAGDVIGLLDKLGIESVNAIGTSTGGCILQNLALDHPERLRACVFSNTWTKADTYVTRLQTLRKWIAQSHGPEAYVEFSTIMTNGTLQFRHNLEGVMALEKRSKDTIGSVEIIAARCDMTMSHDRLAELHRIDRPSLVLGARDDATVPVYFADDLHELIAGSRLHIFDWGGHFCYRLRSDEWNALVGEFLEEHAALR